MNGNAILKGLQKFGRGSAKENRVTAKRGQHYGTDKVVKRTFRRTLDTSRRGRELKHVNMVLTPRGARDSAHWNTCWP